MPFARLPVGRISMGIAVACFAMAMGAAMALATVGMMTGAIAMVSLMAQEGRIKIADRREECNKIAGRIKGKDRVLA